MKKIILFSLTFIFCASFAFGQKIQIKKNNILLDKTEKIGTYYYESGGRMIKDNNGNEVFVTRIMGESGSTSDYYYVLSFNFSDSKMELSNTEISSASKGTIKYLLNNNFWDPKNGIDTEALKLKIEDQGLAISTERDAVKANEERAKAIDPFVDRDGNIYKGGVNGTEIIGYVEAPDHYLATSITPIKIYDIDKNLIAKGKSTIISDEKFITFDDKEHKYRAKYELNELTKTLFLSEMVYSLLLEGYIYGGDVKYDKTISIFKD